MTKRRPPVLGNGWATPVPPYITYPVQNVGWGDGWEPPPYAPARMVPADQAPAPAPVRPQPSPAPLPPAPAEGPIPVQDWFNLFSRGA